MGGAAGLTGRHSAVVLTEVGSLGERAADGTEDLQTGARGATLLAGSWTLELASGKP